MGVVVRLDERGRILIPERFRSMFKAGLALLVPRGNSLELIPLERPEVALEKLRGSRRFGISWREAKALLEELAEREVREGAPHRA